MLSYLILSYLILSYLILFPPEVVAPDSGHVGVVVRVAAIRAVEGFEPTAGGRQVPVAEAHLPLAHQVVGVALAPQVLGEDLGLRRERVVPPPRNNNERGK